MDSMDSIDTDQKIRIELNWISLSSHIGVFPIAQTEQVIYKQKTRKQKQQKDKNKNIT